MCKMLRTVVSALMFTPGMAYATVDCGAQPTLVGNTTEQFKADAAGKAQFFSKFLPQADVTGNIVAWKSEQHQNYKDIDMQQKDLYYEWISCQNIMSSPSMSIEQKQFQWGIVLSAFRPPVHYKTCSRPEFGQNGWQRNVTVNQSSGWVGPGSNQDNWCNQLINLTIKDRGIGSEHDVKIASKSEEGKWGNDFLHTDRQYNYHCNINISWDPLYNSKADPICGVE